MSSNPPRKHHYIPECYLKGFGNAQKQFYRRSKKYSKTSICSPAQVGYEINLFTIKNDETLALNGLSDLNYIERFSFKKQENNYSKILLKIAKKSDFPLKVEKECYNLFIETLITIKRRNPTTKDILIKSLIDNHSIIKSVPVYREYLLEEAFKYNIKLEDGLDEKIEKYIREKGMNPSYQYDMYLSGFLNKDDFYITKDIVKLLIDLKQFILHTPANTQFITSDNPGFTIAGNNILSIGGFGDKFEFFYPLTPNTCLYLNSRKKETAEESNMLVYSQIVSEDVVNKINKFTKLTANEKIFGNSKNILAEV